MDEIHGGIVYSNFVSALCERFFTDSDYGRKVMKFMKMKKKNLCHALSPSEKNATQITALYIPVPQNSLREQFNT